VFKKVWLMLCLTVAAVALTSHITIVKTHGLWCALIPQRVLEVMYVYYRHRYISGWENKSRRSFYQSIKHQPGIKEGGLF